MFDPAGALRDNPALFACYVLFIYFRGLNACRIEREMRELGYTTFHRRNLYPRGRQPGWIGKFSWQSAVGSRQSSNGDLETAARERPSSESTAPPTANSLPPTDFHTWLKRVSPNMNWDWKHLQVIVKQLEEFTNKKRQRLMIFLPPRHGKTELVSVRYTAWRMQRDPSMNVILGSYNQRLADRMSRKIRTTLCDSEAIRLGKTRQPLSVPPAAGVPARASRSGVEDAGGWSQPIEISGGNASVNERGDRAYNEQKLVRVPSCDFVVKKEGLTTNQHELTRNDTNSESPVSGLSSHVSPFPFSRPRPKNTVSEWETSAGGGFRAVGAGSGVTGFGANLIVVDDPVKNRAQAESETFRNRVWDWYKDDLYTRLEPDGSIVLIQTRWHEDDLAGRLLRENLDDWTVINLPALSEASSTAETQRRRERSAEADETSQPTSVPPAVAGGCSHPIDTSTETQTPTRVLSCDFVDKKEDETTNEHEPTRNRTNPESPGSNLPTLVSSSPRLGVSAVNPFEWREAPDIALCPERFDVEALEQQRRQLGTYSFSALYQQRPTPAGGQVFKREWFKQIIDFAPPGLKWKRGYDLAVSTRTGSDYTASFRVAFDDRSGNLYISGGFRRRIEFPDQRRYILDRMLNERDTEHGVELALHGQALIQELRRDPSIRGRSLRGVKVSTDKLTRALTWSPLAEEGKVVLVRSAECGVRNSRSRNSPPFEGGVDAALGGRGGSLSCDTEISPRVQKRQPNNTSSGTPHSALRTPHFQDWISDLLDELSAFPNGTHDDQIDAISIAVQMTSKPKFKSRGFLIT